jgi:hypothetical protein
MAGTQARARLREFERERSLRVMPSADRSVLQAAATRTDEGRRQPTIEAMQAVLSDEASRVSEHGDAVECAVGGHLRAHGLERKEQRHRRHARKAAGEHAGYCGSGDAGERQIRWQRRLVDRKRVESDSARRDRPNHVSQGALPQGEKAAVCNNFCGDLQRIRLLLRDHEVEADDVERRDDCVGDHACCGTRDQVTCCI